MCFYYSDTRGMKTLGYFLCNKTEYKATKKSIK